MSKWQKVQLIKRLSNSKLSNVLKNLQLKRLRSLRWIQKYIGQQQQIKFLTLSVTKHLSISIDTVECIDERQFFMSSKVMSKRCTIFITKQTILFTVFIQSLAFVQTVFSSFPIRKLRIHNYSFSTSLWCKVSTVMNHESP